MNLYIGLEGGMCLSSNGMVRAISLSSRSPKVLHENKYLTSFTQSPATMSSTFKEMD